MEKLTSVLVTQTVNDTNTTFFYCGVPGHCQKGMFGILYGSFSFDVTCYLTRGLRNPPNALMGSTSSVSSMMPVMASNVSIDYFFLIP